MSDTRIGLKLNKEEAQAARRILKKNEMTLSAWIRLQIRKLIESNKPQNPR